MDLVALLRKLTSAPGVSGYEHPVAETIRDLWEPISDDLALDRMGNLIATKRGSGAEPRPTLLAAAHMDEIGFMVSGFATFGEHGFLRITRLGGVDWRQLYGQRVVVHGRQDGDCQLVGVIGALPSSMLSSEKRGKAHNEETLVVDTGLTEERLRQQVGIGDPITFCQPLRTLMGSRVMAKALDNRASVAALTVMLSHLQQRQHAWDVLVVATVQEETRLLGARTSAHIMEPDVALAVDVTFGRGPGAKDKAITFELGGGPAIGLGPNLHEGIRAGLMDAAKAIEMKVHTDPHVRNSGTDAAALQIAGDGIPTGLIGIPLRYMHTMVEVVDTRDIERAGRLLSEFAARLDNGWLETLAESYFA